MRKEHICEGLERHNGNPAVNTWEVYADVNGHWRVGTKGALEQWLIYYCPYCGIELKQTEEFSFTTDEMMEKYYSYGLIRLGEYTTEIRGCIARELQCIRRGHLQWNFSEGLDCLFQATRIMQLLSKMGIIWDGDWLEDGRAFRNVRSIIDLIRYRD